MNSPTVLVSCYLARVVCTIVVVCFSVFFLSSAVPLLMLIRLREPWGQNGIGNCIGRVARWAVVACSAQFVYIVVNEAGRFPIYRGEGEKR